MHAHPTIDDRNSPVRKSTYDEFSETRQFQKRTHSTCDSDLLMRFLTPAQKKDAKTNPFRIARKSSPADAP